MPEIHYAMLSDIKVCEEDPEHVIHHWHCPNDPTHVTLCTVQAEIKMFDPKPDGPEPEEWQYVCVECYSIGISNFCPYTNEPCTCEEETSIEIET